MTKLNEVLDKSLAEVEALADEVLAKSEEAIEEIEKSEEGADEIDKALNPEDVSEGEVGSDDTKKDDKKKDKDEDDEDENEEEDGDEDGEVTQKSFNDYVEENEDITKALEVSDFLSEFTRIHGAVIDGLRGDVEKSLNTSTQTSTVLAKSFNAIMKSQNALAESQKELSKSIQGIQERLDHVEKQPVGRKAQISVMEKSFNHSAGIEEVSEEMSKSEKLSKLSDMVMAGENGVTINDVVSYESSGTLRPEIEELLKN